MKTIPVESQHLELMNSWLNKREMVSQYDMPSIGYISYETELPIAIGFLRLMEGSYAMIDGLCTNPDVPPQLRNRAINCVVDQLILTAKHLKLKKLLAFSIDEKVLMRAERYCFEKQPHTMIVLDLDQAQLCAN